MQDKNPYNEERQPNGQWERYYKGGNLRYKGLWVNGKRYGYHEQYFDDGELSYKGNFINSEFYGYWEEHWDNKIDKEYYGR
jgi:antitoxin component YwqK of YwqJK toxin-antitoxin module